jgi:DNA-directed RNA polymerase specialized sigma24 family protein
MPTNPSVAGLELLLTALDAEPLIAAEKYETLRLKITKILCWKGCPESRSDALADEALDRISEKLVKGEDVRNVDSYAAGIVRFVYLEYSRRNFVDAVGDHLPEVSVDTGPTSFDEEDTRMTCLRACLFEVAPEEDDRRLIVRYYDAEPSAKNKNNRKALAEELGLSVNALKVRACRLRAKLERCINECAGDVTKTGPHDTIRRGGSSG